LKWVLKGADFSDNFNIRLQGDYWSFRWKWPRKSWWYATKPIYVDLGDRLFAIKRLYADVPCGGWGYFVDYARFVQACQGT